MTMMTRNRRRKMEFIHSVDEIPEFASDEEEANYWDTHELAEDFVEGPPIPEEELPEVRPREELPLTISGAELRAWRRRRYLRQFELAGVLGVSERTISGWERETIPIEHGRLLRLALRYL